MNGAQAPVKDMRTAGHSARRALHKNNPAARFYEFLAASPRRRYLLGDESGDSHGNMATALQQNNGPIAIVGLGVVASVLGKYLRG